MTLDLLADYIGKKLTVDLGTYNLCWEEGHAPHGDDPDQYKNSRETIEIIFSKFDKLYLYGIDSTGKERNIPFRHVDSHCGGASYTVIVKIKDSDKILFEPNITFKPEKELFVYKIE